MGSLRSSSGEPGTGPVRRIGEEEYQAQYSRCGMLCVWATTALEGISPLEPDAQPWGLDAAWDAVTPVAGTCPDHAPHLAVEPHHQDAGPGRRGTIPA